MNLPFLRLSAICCAAALMTACASTDRLANPGRLTAPRVAPVAHGAETPEQMKFLASQQASLSRLNVVRTFTVNPQLAEAWQPFAFYVLRTSTLPPRDRELLILRIGWLNQSQYEFTQHVRVAKGVGLTDAEIEMIKVGADSAGWSAFDAALISAASQLRNNSFIDDKVWSILKTRYDDKQLMDVVVTVGQYNLVSWYLNTLGTPFEEGVAGLPMQK